MNKCPFYLYFLERFASQTAHCCLCSIAVVDLRLMLMTRILLCAVPICVFWYRSLFPILSLTPVETEDEMVQLVKCIAEAVGVPEPDEITYGNCSDKLSSWARQLELHMR